MDDIAVVTVSYNTRELTALLVWSLHRVLDPVPRTLLVVDNGSTDGSLEMLRRADRAGLCCLVENTGNVGHGPALNQALSHASVRSAHRVWVLDSDCVVMKPDAYRAALAAHPEAAVIGEEHWDQWRGRRRLELYSLVLDPWALDEADLPGFTADGDPAWNLLRAAESAGLPMASHPFTADGYLVHLGRGSLAAVADAGDESHPLYEWARDHHEPHYGGVEGARERHAAVMRRFLGEVGPDLDLTGTVG